MGSTHRRRRSTLAVVVIVTAVVGVRLTGAGAAPTAAPAGAAANRPSATSPALTSPAPTSPAPTSPAPTRSSPRSSPAPSPSVTASVPGPASSPTASGSAVGGPASCAGDDVRVGTLAAIGDANSALVAGSPVRFTLTVTSVADTACTFAPVLSFTVMSGHDRIWTSGDCPVAAVGGPGTSPAATLSGTAQALLVPGGTLLGAHATATLNLVWPGVRSTGSCTASAPALQAGTYVATAAIPDVGSAGTAFQLR